MTYDLEVWMPSYNRYVEISSCSNFESFQARSADIKFRRITKEKLEFVHTLKRLRRRYRKNDGMHLENYQQLTGHVIIPEVLRKYMKVLMLIKPKGMKIG